MNFEKMNQAPNSSLPMQGEVIDVTPINVEETKAIVLAKVNSGSSSKINSVLKNVFLKRLYPEYASKLSLNLCNAISQKTDWNINTLKTYIQNYSTPVQGGPTVSQGDRGGAIAGTPQSVQGAQSFQDDLNNFLPFRDIENVAWAHESIIGLYNKGCINGREEGMFAPNDNISREEFLKILIMVFDLELVGADEMPFEDVNAEAWYFNYVKTAYLAGVTNGISDTMFGIGQNITRQDLCKMTVNLTNALGKKLKNNSSVSFTDDTQIADYAKEAVYELASAGIVSGNERQEFNPFAAATRAEAAKILYYTMTLVE